MSFVLWGRSLCRQTARISARSPVVGSETAKRFSSTSSSTKRSAKQKHKSHEIRSLNPKWLSSSGQEILDISGRTGKSIKISAQESFFVRYSFEWDPKTGSSRRMVAPPDTTGFLYYHRPRDQPEIAGQIRFRVCSDATRFEQGRDLDGIIPGVPWSIHLWQVVKYWPQFCSALLKEGLVDQSLVDDLKRLNLTLRSGLILYSLSDPITLKLSHEKINITFVTRKTSHQIPLRRLFAEQTHQTSDNAPYEGIIKARFELSDLPEHEPYGPTLVLRTLGILQPITPVDPSYSGRIPMPEPGALVKRCRHRKHYLWFLPVKQLDIEDNFDFPGLVWP